MMLLFYNSFTNINITNYFTSTFAIDKINLQTGGKMNYKNFEIVYKPELNAYAIIDSKFNQEIKCKSVQACKIRISKILATRQRMGIL